MMDVGLQGFSPSGRAVFAVIPMVLYLVVLAQLCLGRFRSALLEGWNSGSTIRLPLAPLGFAALLVVWSVHAFTAFHTINQNLVGSLPLLGTFMIAGLLYTSLASRSLNLALLLIPVVVLLLGSATLLAPQETSRAVINGLSMFNGNLLLMTHIIILYCGSALLFVSFMIAALLLLHDRSLKRRSLGFFWRIVPPLQTMDRLLTKLVLFGYFCITVGMTLGLILAHSSWADLWSSNPRVQFKVYFTLFDWIWFGILLQGHFVRGWRGRRLALLTMVGVCAVAITFIGIGLI